MPSIEILFTVLTRKSFPKKFFEALTESESEKVDHKTNVKTRLSVKK